MNLKCIIVGVVLGLAPLWSGGAQAGLQAYALPELEEMALKTCLLYTSDAADE